ncbi:hypothetical protein ES332_A03G204300v1 [Gossypium tomentosum]|uniref:Uncharacterized protein n=1 Tax=Gossypium tomentosum TaxID=34277 RepID=A0A5D2RAV4_GOSTO|nr:hypothetical protein ES332_A03G204300v1 [Gossypium tomentosum]
MGDPIYPPAVSSGRQANGASSSFTSGALPRPSLYRGKFKGIDYQNNWSLPPAQNEEGAMLVLPNDISKWPDVITRWESCNKNVMNRIAWLNNKSKVDHIENLLGEIEKKTFQQWRASYPQEYEVLITMADDPQNLFSQIRRIFTFEDPYQGSTAFQDRAYADLEALPRPSLYRGKFKGIDYQNNWSLPPAQNEEGAMLVLPNDISKWPDVITRWESCNKNVMNRIAWPNNKSKVDHIENLLGEIEKRTFQQWRASYPQEYEVLITMADDPQNLFSQIRRIFTFEDPYQGSTAFQDRAYADLKALTCNNIGDIIPFVNQYKALAANSGRMFLSTELSDKLFRKIPQPFGKILEDQFRAKFGENVIGVFPRIAFIHTRLTEMCQQARIDSEIKKLDFCKDIPLPTMGDFEC